MSLQAGSLDWTGIHYVSTRAMFGSGTESQVPMRNRLVLSSLAVCGEVDSNAGVEALARLAIPEHFDQATGQLVPAIPSGPQALMTRLQEA